MNIIKYHQNKKMSILWTYNKKRSSTTIADGRKNEWKKRTWETENNVDGNIKNGQIYDTVTVSERHKTEYDGDP